MSAGACARLCRAVAARQHRRPQTSATRGSRPWELTVTLKATSDKARRSALGLHGGPCSHGDVSCYGQVLARIRRTTRVQELNSWNLEFLAAGPLSALPAAGSAWDARRPWRKRAARLSSTDETA